MPSKNSTLTEILRWRAVRQSRAAAFTFLAEGEREEGRLSYFELDEQARIFGALLQRYAGRGERVLLLYEAGLEFVKAFMGCLYSGIIAVPAPPPHPSRLNRTVPRVQAIAKDAQPTVVLTTSSILAMIEGMYEDAPDLKSLRWLATDSVALDSCDAWREVKVSPEDLAYLQYTSGSTSTPKGVMVSHENLVNQSAYLGHAYDYTAESVSATWMPNFHDYGLVEGIVHPACVGIPAYLMSPLAFVQKPARWLQVATRYGVTHSSGPNFAYELCVRKVTPEQRATLNLESWRAAGNAAEPVHPETMERFYETFKSCGFAWKSFYPSYGLAEGTLMVAAGAPRWHGPLFRTVEVAALEQEKKVVDAIDGSAGARRVVGCGHPILDTKIAIVHPETLQRCKPDEIGEIWFQNICVPQGYWNREADTAEKFLAYIPETGEGPFLRTGDLGFIKDGQVFVSGRFKDLIIIRGQNYYPQDIEWTSENSHRLLRPGCCAAFSVDVDNEERLVIVQEVRSEYDPDNKDEIIGAIRQTIVEQHEIQPHAIVLVRAGSINKTSSGKIQRHASRQEYLAGSLDSVAHWRAPVVYESRASHTDQRGQTVTCASDSTVERAISEWLRAQIAARIGVGIDEVDTRQPFAYYGFDSAQVVGLTGDLSGWLGRSLSPTLFWDYPTVEAVATHLSLSDAKPAAPAFVAAANMPLINEPIAIIGMSCRFPGAKSTDDFWTLLEKGMDAVTDLPVSRRTLEGFNVRQGGEPGVMGVSRGGFLEDVDKFDAQFFNISPREAVQIDPQQRLLLEVAWEALEVAGHAGEHLNESRTGVFVGISSSDYARLQVDARRSIDGYAGTGTALSIAANRLSYFLNLHGPSVAVDTACSSSLVAVHMACQSLRTGESNMALAGGVNLILTPDMTVALSQARMMSADGRCKTFDASADGYVRSEGCGVIVLKRLSDARRDKDNILALIRGSATNQDGRSNGLTAPNGRSQQALIRQALKNGGVEPHQISYVETHGTGTPLGDPIEVEALSHVLSEGRRNGNTCAIGSVKTNIGHLEAAAGIAGLIKVVLALQHGQIPPHLHLQTLNPYISLKDAPLEIVTKRRPWSSGAERRFAGVSSFGFGGTNAHVVLEEPPITETSERDLERSPHLLTLTAQTEPALRQLAGRFAVHLANHPEQSLPDVCFTANTGRPTFAHRLAITGATAETLTPRLHAFANGEDTGDWHYGHSSVRNQPKLAFLFTGQGAQYAHMARKLYDTHPLFRQTMNLCDEILRPHLDESLLDVLYPKSGESGLLNQTAYTQPALFALEYSLAKLWLSWGIEPGAVLGHSIGEYAAASISGAFTLEEGLKLIAERGRLMQSLSVEGEMAVVFADEVRVAATLAPYAGRVSIAAVNGPKHTVISGAASAVRAVRQQFEAEGSITQALTVSHAFHSPLVEPMLNDFDAALRRISFQPLRIPLVSNLTGEIIESGSVLDAAYWKRHAREPVMFARGVQTLAARGFESFLEVGPHPSLLGMAKRCLPEESRLWVPTLKRGQDDWQVLLQSLGTLYARGVRVDWDNFDGEYKRQRVVLPTYPFERKSYWLNATHDEWHHERVLKETPAVKVFAESSDAAVHQHVSMIKEGQTRMEQDPNTSAVEPQQGKPHSPARRDSILSTLRGITARVLHTTPEQVDVNAPFLEIGADSIVLAEAIRIIEDKLNVRLSIRLLFEEATTLEALASYIDERLPATSFASLPVAQEQTPLHTDYTAAVVQPVAPPPTTSPTATGSVHDTVGGQLATSLEQVVNQQLGVLSQFSGIMSQQLELLRLSHTHAPGTVNAQPASPSYSDALPATRSGNGASQEKRAVTVEPDNVAAAKTSGQSHASSPNRLAQPTAGGESRSGKEPYVPYRPIRSGQVGGFNERQQKHLEALITRHIARTAQSKRIAQAYRPALADSRAIVGFRLSIKEMLYPIVGAGGEGSRIRDVDGNEYIDITMGFGVHLFGHHPPFIMQAIEEQLEQGIEMGPRPEKVGEVAALICELTGMERATFCNSGTEAVMTALRLARAKTGRTKVAMFAGSYHGHSDGTLARAQTVDGSLQSAPLAPGIPPHVVEDLLVLEYGSEESLEIIRARGQELAAVIVEPVQSRHPDLQPKEFLHELRRLTEATGTVLIFDEMVTGFRIHPGGAQAWFGVAADIATYGKIVGGGLPIGVVAGKAPFMAGIDGGMWNYGDASHPQAETTYFGGTFCQHPLAMASALAVLKHLKQQGSSLQQELNQRTNEFARTLNDYFLHDEVPMRLAHFGSLFRFSYTGNFDLLFYHLLEKGIYVWEWRNCFLSTAHTQEDIARIIRAVKESVEEMRDGEFLPPSSNAPRVKGVAPAATSSASVSQPSKACVASDTTAQNVSQPEEVRAPAHGERTSAAQVDATQPLGFWGRTNSKPSLFYRGDISNLSGLNGHTNRTLDFSLYYFGNYSAEFEEHKYELLFKGAKYADENGFAALWIPERHFHSFGGFSPNPSVVAAALARETTRLHLRAGSVVLPLHHPVRVAEEWAVVDNISKGRVGISFASGWHPDDFIFAPEAYGKHRELMFERIEEVKKLWRGESVLMRGGAGNEINVRLHPMPMRRTLPVWITIVNNTDTYRRAGEMGANVLTNLMGQTIENLADNIAIYRRALAENGHDAEAGKVTVLLHAFVGADADAVRQQAFRPFCEYLKSSLGLLQNLVKSQNLKIDFDRLSAEDMNYLLSAAYERYVHTSALIGSPDTCSAVIDQLKVIGVDEVGCFIDFGVNSALVLENLPYLSELRERHQQQGDATSKNGQPPLTIASQAAPGAARDEHHESLFNRDARAIPLTEAQKQLWVLAQMGGEASCAYNEVICLQLRGRLNPESLHRAFQEVVNRHEALRTSISRDGDLQFIYPAQTIDMGVHDFSSAASPDDLESSVTQWLRDEHCRSFDLTQVPLARFHLLKLEQERHLLVVCVHHIMADGWSIGVMLEEVSAIYESECMGTRHSLSPTLQFKDYTRWLEQPAQRARRAADITYWLNHFADSSPISDFPVDYLRPSIKTYAGAREHARLDADLCASLKDLSRRNGCTLFMTMFAAYALLLHRATGQDEVVLGIPVAGRSLEGGEQLVGYCTRPLPVRSRLVGNPTFKEYLSSIRHELLEAYEHQDVTLHDLIERLNLPRDASRFPLFSNTFNMERLSLPKMFELQVDLFPFPIGCAKFDNSLHLFEHEGQMLLDWDYNTHLFDGDSIRRFLKFYEMLLRSASMNPSRRVAELALIDEPERQQLLFGSSNAPVNSVPNKSIHELFEEIVSLHGEKVAVECDGECLTYAELNTRANQLAHYLHNLGIRPGVLVGVIMERSIEMVVGLLGILKSGGAYLPLDASHPPQRLLLMLEDAKSPLVLTQSHLLERLGDFEGGVICLDEEWPSIARESERNGVWSVGAENLAYVIYTSGSTGTPKGVAVSHRAVNSLVIDADYVWLGLSDVVAQVSNSSFDAATFEIWGALLNGARLVIINKDISLSPVEFGRQLKERGVTTLFLTTALFNIMAREVPRAFTQVKHLLTGGEAVDPACIREVLRQEAPERLLHVYGPTETTTFATWHRVTDVVECAITVPIGRAIANKQIYLLDELLNPVPVGIRGEIYIGGDGLARGYLDQPALTAESFVPHAFSHEPGARLYRTGDIARYRSDGSIEFLERRDQQIKIRGFRVEPGEVEVGLVKHPKVAHAAVVGREDVPGDKRLIAYFVVKDEQSVSTGELRRYLKERLPQYMVPAAFVQVEEMPLTPTGKVDRKALPPPTEDRPELEVSFVAPSTPLETQLANFWSEVLSIEAVGLDDDFFELGGHSLRATQVISRVRRAFGVELPMRAFFESPTIAGLTRVIEPLIVNNAASAVSARL